MNFYELAKSRYSVRKFKPDAVEEEKLNKIIEAGRIAPTACNFQPQRVFVAKSNEARQKLKKVCACTFDAPVILVVCYDIEKSWKNKLMPPYQSGETDASIVATHMMLQAWELGIGSCWVGWFNEANVRKELNLPDNLVVSCLLPMGYASEEAKPSKDHNSYLDINETVMVI